MALPEKVTAPSYLDLFIGSDVQAHSARVVWQRLNVIGIVFLEPRAGAPEVRPD